MMLNPNQRFNVGQSSGVMNRIGVAGNPYPSNLQNNPIAPNIGSMPPRPGFNPGIGTVPQINVPPPTNPQGIRFPGSGPDILPQVPQGITSSPGQLPQRPGLVPQNGDILPGAMSNNMGLMQRYAQLAGLAW